MLLHTWLPATLRAAGITVVETSGWTSRSHGALPDKVKVVWHHDASPPGDSPGALQWMISNYPSSSANIWVDRKGVWHLVGTGVSWHAGKVKSGMPDNFSSIGIETDHTTAELWPPAQLDALRKGTAAMFSKQGVGSDWLHFHKTICTPTGRKSDPDGLDLGPERARVAQYMSGGGNAPATPPAGATAPPKPPTPPAEEDMTPYTEAQMKSFAEAGARQFAATQEFRDRVMQACNESLSRNATTATAQAKTGSTQFGATQEFKDRVMVACQEALKRAGVGA